MKLVKWNMYTADWWDIMRPYIAKFADIDALDGDEAYDSIMQAFAEDHNCTYMSNSDSFTCSEEAFLIIKLKCPELINKYVSI